MKRKILSICSISILLISFLGGSSSAYSDIKPAEYIYSSDLTDVPIPDAYIYKKTVELMDSSGGTAVTPKDMALSKDGEIYVLDSGNNRVLIYNTDLTLKNMLSEFKKKDGSVTNLNAPEGIHVSDRGEIYIADTQNNRIIKCDKGGNVILEIEKPANMVGVDKDTIFYPTKVGTDSIGRIYAVARNINMGMLCLDDSGEFLSFVGAPSVKPDLFDIIWRRFSTKAQKAQMTQYVSTEYNNLVVDSENFIWGTISALDAGAIRGAVSGKDKSGTVTPIAKINSTDEDILKRNGLYAPLGDLKFKKDQSRIIDIALGSGGIYSLLDYQRGRIFTYDDNGNLLYIFGEIGNKKGDFKSPVALFYSGDNIFVLDSELEEITVFEPTEYGRLVIKAVTSQYQGDYDAAYKLWEEVAKSNSNFEYAYIGMGNVCVDEGQYQKAMYYYKYASNTAKYSEAFEKLRQQKMESGFIYIFLAVGILIIIFILLSFVKRIIKYIRG